MSETDPFLGPTQNMGSVIMPLLASFPHFQRMTALQDCANLTANTLWLSTTSSMALFRSELNRFQDLHSKSSLLGLAHWQNSSFKLLCFMGFQRSPEATPQGREQ